MTLLGVVFVILAAPCAAELVRAHRARERLDRWAICLTAVFGLGGLALLIWSPR